MCWLLSVSQCFSFSVCVYRANPVWLDPFCRNLELAAQAEHEDDLPEDLSDIADLWNSPARTHVTNSQKHCQNHSTSQHKASLCRVQKWYLAFVESKLTS